jgi:ribosomal protein S18 acetylase RimI-like enzyme
VTTFSTTRAIAHGDAVATFDCGVACLNNWLRNQAVRNQDSGASRTFVTVAGDGTIAGYYSLSSYSVARADTGDRGEGMPDPVPVTLIGRLAVDVRFRGHRLGESLLQDAALRALRVSLEIGCAGILVRTQDEDVIPFYERYGFSRLAGDPRALLLTMNDAKATLASLEAPVA